MSQPLAAYNTLAGSRGNTSNCSLNDPATPCDDRLRHLCGLGKVTLNLNFQGPLGRPRSRQLEGLVLVQQLSMRLADSDRSLGDDFVLGLRGIISWPILLYHCLGDLPLPKTVHTFVCRARFIKFFRQTDLSNRLRLLAFTSRSANFP